MSTSTAMSDCFQPGQAIVALGPTPLGESKENPEHKFDAVFGTISRCFQRSKQKLLIIFSLELGRLKIEKPICACTESTDLIE